MKRLLVLFLIVISVLTFADQTSEEVTVEGVGAIKDGNMAKGRDEAIWDAQRRAVEKGVGVFLTSETQVQNGRLLEDNIYTQSNGFVDDYKILSENKDEFLYYIKIKAVVKTSEIGDKLLLLGLIKKIGDPRIMVFLDGDQTSADIAENLVAKYLTDAGYRTVDKTQIAKIRASESARKAAEGNIKEAEQIAQQFGSDVIITGRVDGEIEEISAYNMVTKSYKGVITLKVIKVDTGEILLTVTRNATAPLAMNKSEAAERALSKVVKEMAEGKSYDKKEAYIYNIAKSLLQKPSVQIILSGINSDQYAAVLKVLKDERTIKKVFGREISGSIARIDIDYDRPTEKLKEVIEGIKEVPIKVEGFSKSKVDAKIIKPIVIEIKNIGSFSEFSDFVSKLSERKDVKVINKKFSTATSVIEMTTNGDLMKIMDQFTAKYEILDFADEKVLLQKNK